MSEQTVAQRPYLTLKEAAPLTGMGVEWLWKRVGRKNGPPYVKRGRKIFLPRKEFEEWNKQKIIR